VASANVVVGIRRSRGRLPGVYRCNRAAEVEQVRSLRPTELSVSVLTGVLRRELVAELNGLVMKFNVGAYPRHGVKSLVDFGAEQGVAKTEMPPRSSFVKVVVNVERTAATTDEFSRQMPPDAGWPSTVPDPG